MDLQGFLNTALAIISLATLAGLGLMRGTVTGLRESNGDLRDRVGDLEKERAEDKTTIGELSGENKMLQSMVMGRVDWGAISDLVEEHHRQALKQWLDLNRKLDEAVQLLKRLLEDK